MEDSIYFIEDSLGPLIMVGLVLGVGGYFVFILAPDVAIMIALFVIIAFVIGVSLIIGSWLFEWLG